MNLLLLRDEDFVGPEEARLIGRRATHAREVLRAQAGDRLRVGRLGGNTGEAEVLANDAEGLRLRVALTSPPPPRPGVDLVLAIPRPKALKKVLPAAASLGVERIVLLNAFRVEKSYFDSKVLDPAFLEELLVLGLEQARDTRMPELLVRERFRPFVEDELDGLFPQGARLVPHPTAATTFPALLPESRVTLAIGPEGGWIPFELELLSQRGFLPVSLGARILRVETVVPYLLGRLGDRARRP
jgi:RsmE family RNA methyltransferase